MDDFDGISQSTINLGYGVQIRSRPFGHVKDSEVSDMSCHGDTDTGSATAFEARCQIPQLYSAYCSGSSKNELKGIGREQMQEKNRYFILYHNTS